MKQIGIISFLVLQVVISGGTVLFGAPQITLLKESAVWLEGDSTLHRFSSTSTAFAVEMEAQLPPSANANDFFYGGLKNGELKKLELRIPVLSLKSDKAALDKNLAKALNAKGYPDIVFQMTGYEMALSSANPKDIDLSVKGALTIAGKSKDIVLKAVAKPESGVARATGSCGLLMTDYGVQPPSLMMGTIKVKNEIVVRYSLYFAFVTADKKTGGN